MQHDADEVQMMLAEDSMKIKDWGAAIRSLEKYLTMEPGSNKAKKMLETAKKRQEQDKAKAKASPKPKRVFSTGMWTMARASTRSIGTPRKTKEEIAAGYMKRRRDREVKAREDFRASKQQDVFSLVSAIGAEKKKGPAMKLAFGKGNVSLSRIVNQGSGKLLGKAGVHHLHLGPTRQRLTAAVYLIRFGSPLHLPTRLNL